MTPCIFVGCYGSSILRNELCKEAGMWSLRLCVLEDVRSACLGAVGTVKGKIALSIVTRLFFVTKGEWVMRRDDLYQCCRQKLPLYF
jgi:hypothetical protein